MSEINYDDARIEGGVRVFEGVEGPDQTKPEVGESPVPSPEQARTYANFIELVLDAQQLPVQDEGLLAAT